MQAKGNTRQSAPRAVRPVITAWEWTTMPSPSSTWGPTRQKGPISTLVPSFALGSTTAVAWMLAMLARLSLYDHGTDLGFGDERAVDMRLRPEAPHTSAVAHLLNMIVDGVARHHRAAKAGLVDRHEID